MFQHDDWSAKDSMFMSLNTRADKETDDAYRKAAGKPPDDALVTRG